MAFVVVFDACVLHPQSLRDLFVRVAQTNLVRARWTDRILDECFRSVLERYPEIDPERLERTRRLMNAAARDALVTGYQTVSTSIVLPDPNDQHVVEAAIKSAAQVIVTFNLKDFPASALAPLHIEAKHPDEFVLDLIGLDGARVLGLVRQQATATRKPPLSVDHVLARLETNGLVRSVSALRSLDRENRAGLDELTRLTEEFGGYEDELK